ncbi:MAG: AMIN domain-containing protein [Terriglobales bacterium]
MIARFQAGLLCLSICIGSAPASAQTSAQASAKTPAPQPAALVSAPPVASLRKVDVSRQPDGLAITIALSAAVVPTADRLENPDRLVFDFPGCELKGANPHLHINQGPVKGLRMSQFSLNPPVARIVVDLNAPSEFELKPSQKQVVIQIPFAKSERAPVAASVSSPAIKPVVSSSPPPSIIPAPSIKTEPSIRKEQPSINKEQQPIKKEPSSPFSPPPSPAARQDEPDLVVHPSPPAPSAYTLMAKAKTLNVGDLQEIEDKSGAGDPEAQTMLALAYHAGVLLKKDDAQAIQLLHNAADRGSMAAEESLGIFAETGVGTDQPAPADALNWYRKAAEHGSLDAATSIALMYANGKGVKRDIGQAVTWFRRAADGGDASAQYNLALMYERGEGVPQDYRAAARWLRFAADQNLVPAILDLAEISLQPPDPKMSADIGKAVAYYQKAADLGSPVAQSSLGTILTRGLTGKVDYDQAVMWYRKAAEQGDPDGELGLGVSYALGHGVAVDFDEARRLLTAAADKGQIEAQYDLAIMYEEGKGMPPDSDIAERYYQSAADHGMVKAQYRYGLLLSKRNGSSTNRIAAYKWLMLAQDSIKESSPLLSELRKSMSPQETAEAEREVDNWRLIHQAMGR